MTTSSTSKSDIQFTEAMASWNTKYITPEGFECQLTLRGELGQEVLERAQGAITFLLKNGCTPSNNKAQKSFQPMQRVPEAAGAKVAAGNHNGNGNGNHTPTNSSQPQTPAPTVNHKDDPGWCPIHQCEMRKWEKDGRVWYSHQVDGQWCNGKSKNK